jgi:hypothetical protein
MSALPPKADIETQSRDVRFVPKADILRCSKQWPLGAVDSQSREPPRITEDGAIVFREAYRLHPLLTLAMFELQSNEPRQ